jgi:UDP:flavonoid glycosyltransferase YjiC (YdhE family)
MVCDAISFGCTLAAHDFDIPLIRNSPGILMDPVADSLFLPNPLIPGQPSKSFFVGLRAAFFNTLFPLYSQFTFLLSISQARGDLIRSLSTPFDIWESDVHLVNSIYGFEYPRALQPNTLFVGPQILPNNGSEIALSTPFVLISFGTVFAPNFDLVNTLITALELFHEETGTLVIWQTKNTAEWLPQNDWLNIVDWVNFDSVFSNPSLKFLVSHGGGTIIHSLCKGVPAIAIPIGADQPGMASRLERCGAGISIDSAASVTDFLNGFYKVQLKTETAKHISQVFRADNVNIEKVIELILINRDFWKEEKPSFAFLFLIAIFSFILYKFIRSL